MAEPSGEISSWGTTKTFLKVGTLSEALCAVDCFDLTGADFASKTQTWRYVLSGNMVGCFRMAARYAPVAKAEIDAALSLDAIDAPEPPVSCAALAARQLGASAEHATMAAGFAGGRFACAEIVGRKFENVADHAAFVRDGGCTSVVEALDSR
jgi:hypothetical protein